MLGREFLEEGVLRELGCFSMIVSPCSDCIIAPMRVPTNLAAPKFATQGLLWTVLFHGLLSPLDRRGLLVHNIFIVALVAIRLSITISGTMAETRHKSAFRVYSAAPIRSRDPGR